MRRFLRFGMPLAGLFFFSLAGWPNLMGRLLCNKTFYAQRRTIKRRSCRCSFPGRTLFAGSGGAVAPRGMGGSTSHYNFEFNGSTEPEVCDLNLFEKTFVGFRKIDQSQ